MNRLVQGSVTLSEERINDITSGKREVTSTAKV